MVNSLNDMMMSIVPSWASDADSAAIRHKLALKSTGVVTWEWDLATDAVIADDDFYALFCINPSAPLKATAIVASIHNEDQPGVRAALEETFVSDAGEYNCRFRVRNGPQEWRWVQGKGQVSQRDAEGKATKLIGINYDVSDIVKYEERLAAIAGEMRHRVKNSLAMVNALASATARETDTLDEFLRHFRGRVDAIAAAQRISAHETLNAGMDCLAAVDGGLAPFKASSEWNQRITIDASEPAPLSVSLGQAVALAIYELATNSVKYGALSDQAGQITIKILKQDDQTIVDWHETFAKDATIDTLSSGFGSTLIARLVRAEHGTIERDLSNQYLHVTLSFPDRT